MGTGQLAFKKQGKEDVLSLCSLIQCNTWQAMGTREFYLKDSKKERMNEPSIALHFFFFFAF